MSKYVRTTDGRIIHLNQCVVTDCAEAKVLYVSDRLNPSCVREIPYVKQADAIEELCDEFVVVWDKDEYTERTVYHYLDEEEFKGLLKAKFTIYGAIWDKRGLIYVAKMNEKGEFKVL